MSRSLADTAANHYNNNSSCSDPPSMGSTSDVGRRTRRRSPADANRNHNSANGGGPSILSNGMPEQLPLDGSCAYAEISATHRQPQAQPRPSPMMTISFVADDLIDQIRLASPTTATSGIAIGNNNNSMPNGTVTSTQAQPPQHVDATVIGDIEYEAQCLADAVDELVEQLGALLHNISAMCADNVSVYRTAVCRLTDSMDANIKCMYTIMAKAEEIGKLMQPTGPMIARIHDIKRLVDMLDVA